MDMREIGKKFPADKFDAAWVCASLLHITKKDTPLVLEGLKKIVKNGGQIYIGLKSGDEDELIVEETKYGKYMQRKFVFWQKEEFKNLLEDLNFKLKNFTKIETKDTSGIETSWLNYYIEVVK
jgi:ubiquinone/menaquinone biosynthesis C-methylase UbiE